LSANRPDICDYEGSTYRTEFWGDERRDYEDRVERMALRRLLPPTGQRVLQIGAGFGRLTDELRPFQQVVLLDYSHSMLHQAHERLGDAPHGQRHIYVAADVYRLPFAPGAFDAATMIRVIHHLVDPPSALRQLRAALADGATFVLEFANKRNIKAIARYLLGRQDWNPFDRAPVEFAPLHFDLHPAYVRRALEENGFVVRRQLTVSHFRLALLKRLVPTAVLAALDSLVQPTGRWWQYTPSVFVLAQTTGRPAPPTEALFKCPECGCLEMEETATSVDCLACGRRYPLADGIYNFKEPGLSR
jgi:SAM-dependent methyltransferase